MVRAAGTLLAALVAVTLFITAVNFYSVQKEEARPAQPPAPPVASTLSPFREVLHFVRHQLDLDREGNFTTWLSSMELAIAGAVALGLAAVRGRRRWIVVALGLFYLSMDESIQIHEWIGGMLWNSNLRFGFIVPPYPWILFFTPILLAFGIWMLTFVRDELRDQPRLRWLGLVALSFMAASLPLEVMGGMFERVSLRWVRVATTLEETCELIGEATMLYLLVSFFVRSLAPPRERAIDVWSGLERQRKRRAHASAPEPVDFPAARVTEERR